MKYIYIFANAFTVLTGGDRHFIEVVKRWQRIDEVEIVLVIPRLAEEVCSEEGLNAKCIIIPPKDTKRLGLIFTYIIRTIIALFKVPRFKDGIIVYSASDSLPDVLPALFVNLLKRNSKWVACSFHLVEHYSKRHGRRLKNMISFYMQRLGIFIIRLADLVIVDNSILKWKISEMGIDAKNIFISSMGIDNDYIRNIEKGDCIYDGCFVGRLHPAKGIFDLIDIWKEVVRQKESAKLSIIGKGDDNIVNELNGKIRKFGLEEHINLLGFLNKDEMFRILKSSRIFVFPSHEEGWGIAIAEAMACGLPVVIYDLPALREVFPQGVVRIKQGDIKNFAREIIVLLGDHERYKKLQLDANEIAGRYNWDNVAKKELERISI